MTTLQERDHASAVKEIVMFMARLAGSGEIPFSNRLDPWTQAPALVRNTSLVNQLRICLGVDFNAVYETFRMHTLHPSFTPFVEQVMAASISASTFRATEKEVINKLVADLRAKSASGDLKRQIYEFERASLKSAASVRRYIRWLNANFDELTVVLLTVSYSEEHLKSKADADLNPSSEERGKSQPAVDLDPSMVKSDFRSLMKFVSAIPSKVGHVSKLKHGADTSYRIHLMLLFADDKRDEATLAQFIGEQWSKKVAEDRGTYEVHKSPAAKIQRRHLEEIALSLIEVDSYAVLNVPGIEKTLSMGEREEKVDPRQAKREVEKHRDDLLLHMLNTPPKPYTKRPG